MLDPRPPPLTGIEAAGSQESGQGQEEEQQQQLGPAATRSSSLGSGSGLRALVVQLGAAATSPMAAAACARPSSLPIFRHHQQHDQQRRQPRVQEAGAGAAADDDDDDASEELVEIVLDGAEAGEAGEVEAKATCMICYAEDLPPESTFSAPRGHFCPHSFCRVCVAEYVRVRVVEGRSDFPCPLINEAACSLIYGEAELAQLLDPETLRKYQRLQAIRSDPSLRECPTCHTLVSGAKGAKGLACSSCGTVFCLRHGLSHSSQECVAFEAAMRRLDRASAATVRRTSKRCPRCKAPTEKDGGCNHIQCINCRFEWCWLCNSKYTPYHYSPTNLFWGCPGAQFLDIGAAGRGGAATCCSCVPGQLTASLCRLTRFCLAVLLLPGPLVLGAAVGLALSVLWLPIGLAWALAAACRRSRSVAQDLDEEQQHHARPRRRPLVSCMGGGWEALDLAFPLVACTRAFREGNGPWGAAYVLIFLGAAPLIIALALLLQILWLPLAALVMIIRASRHRRCRPNVLIYPLTAAAMILDIDGE